jgi:cytochrome c-type biogenesis protein CcmH/NrfG
MSSKPKKKNRTGSNKNRQQSKAHQASVAQTKVQASSDKKDRKKRVTEILVVVFAVIMAATMMLPSLSAIFTSSSSSSSTTDAATTDASTDASTDATTDATTTNSMDTLDAKYADTVSTLETKLESNSNDLATLLALGNDYFSWGYQGTSYATTDEEKSHVNDLLSKAEGYYDSYLALNDSGSVHVDRALCQYYSGDTDGATAALEQYTTDNPDFGPAWANLGMMYASASRTDDAKAAFQKAIDADPDDKYGVKSYATSYLSSLESSSDSASSSSSSSSSTSGTSLSDALQSASGTTL